MRLVKTFVLLLENPRIFGESEQKICSNENRFSPKHQTSAAFDVWKRKAAEGMSFRL
jgi:hypothetical protein